jgi:hypothetical protein
VLLHQKAHNHFNFPYFIFHQSFEGAEKRCRKLKMGQVPFSDKLKDASNIVEARTLQLSKCKVSSRLIKHTFQQEKIEYKRDITLTEGLLARNEAIKHKKKAPELRKTFSEQLAQARAEEGNTSAEKELTARTIALKLAQHQARHKQTPWRRSHLRDRTIAERDLQTIRGESRYRTSLHQSQ